MPINFSTTVVGLRNYFALATPYGTELIITINSSQLVKLLVKSHIKITVLTLDRDALSLMTRGYSYPGIISKNTPQLRSIQQRI